MAAVLPSPLSASREPNQSFGPVFDDLRNACCDQCCPLRTKTYAAPVEVSAFWSLSQPVGLTPVARQSSSSEPASSVLPSSLKCDVDAERVAAFGVRGLDVRLLRPGRAGAR